jgi:hypothetical protein
MMKLECQLFPDDYVKAQYVHLRPSPVFVWLGWIVVALFPLLVVGLFPFAKKSGEWTPFILLVLAAGWLGIHFLILLPRSTRRIFWQQKSLQEKCILEIDAMGVVSTSSMGHAIQKWGDFTKYKRGKGLILAYQSDVIFQMFPKRWFTEEQYAELESYLRQALGKSS